MTKMCSGVSGSDVQTWLNICWMENPERSGDRLRSAEKYEHLCMRQGAIQ